MTEPQLIKLQVPNTHAIWDPAWARSVIREHYGEQLHLYQELLRFAADLALRALSSAPDNIPQHMIISVLFRQIIAAADAVGELLQAGAVDQAHLQLRALLEARWGLIHGLVDPEKWGRRIYVASQRENRARMRRLIPGTHEYNEAEYERDLRNNYGEQSDASMNAAEAQKYCEAIDAVLAKSENREANEALEKFAKEKRREVQWYFDAPADKLRQIKSIRGLARRVGALGEYDSVYKYASDHVHGGYTGTSLSFDDIGVYVAPLRSPEGLRQTLVLAFGLLSESCLRVIRTWRAPEEAPFVETYKEKWRGLIRDCPDVVIERTPSV
ncbi:MAG: DUF5677 domain-containing protein [Gemmatimonadaceae bacterium]